MTIDQRKYFFWLAVQPKQFTSIYHDVIILVGEQGEMHDVDDL